VAARIGVDGICEGVRVPARMEVGRYKGTTKSCRTAATLPQIQQRNKATELGPHVNHYDLLASAEIRQETTAHHGLLTTESQPSANRYDTPS